MHEMFWHAEPIAIDMYSLKKHSVDEKHISSLSKDKYEELKSSQWA